MRTVRAITKARARPISRDPETVVTIRPAATVSAMEKIMSTMRRGMLGLAIPAICTTVLVASIGCAAAQYYCDDRFQSCQTYRQPPPIFPFGLFQLREYAPPVQPAPRDLPSRPSYAAPPTGMRQYAALYAPVRGEPFPVTAVRLSEINPEYLRKTVYYPAGEAPGTIIIDTSNRFLYLLEGGGRAIRYGVGVGRQGFA